MALVIMCDGNKKNQGFTLIETMVAVSIFIIVITVVSNLFVISSRLHKNAALKQKIQSDARLILATLVERIRESTIDYGYYEALGSDLSEPVDVLALVDKQGESIRFANISDAQVCPEGTLHCLGIQVSGGAWNSMTSLGVRLSGENGLRFYIRPFESPFEIVGSAFVSNEQPNVTVVFTLETTLDQAVFRNRSYFQTSASTRVYKR